MDSLCCSNCGLQWVHGYFGYLRQCWYNSSVSPREVAAAAADDDEAVAVVVVVDGFACHVIDWVSADYNSLSSNLGVVNAAAAAVDVVAVVVVVGGSMFGEAGGAEDEDDEAEDEADDRDDVLVDELVEETFLADSAALLRTMRLIDETEGKLSSSQIPSDCNWFLISQANIVGLAFL